MFQKKPVLKKIAICIPENGLWIKIEQRNWYYPFLIVNDHITYLMPFELQS